MFATVIAAVFVVLWSTGFVVARAITPYADPNLFLLARFGDTALIFALAAAASRATWPSRSNFGKHLLAGALLQGVYLGAGYWDWAVAQGLSTGVMALLGALQPLATAAVAAPLFGERLSRRGWTGMALGLAGVVLVLEPKLASATPPAAHGNAPAWLVVLISIVAIAAGMLFQKTSLAWGIVMLSGISITLLVWMVRRDGAHIPRAAARRARRLCGFRRSAAAGAGCRVCRGARGGMLLARS
ncbi:MAG: Permease of the drug/metabolite transporter (DMT) superfamily [uncultured Paraburkholderia sp.]|nr:MAG: Permease of the drug/metabolite transporter (DMT) superfamily [uncultured Paraburkholderia sp.]